MLTYRERSLGQRGKSDRCGSSSCRIRCSSGALRTSDRNKTRNTISRIRPTLTRSVTLPIERSRFTCIAQWNGVYGNPKILYSEHVSWFKTRDVVSRRRAKDSHTVRCIQYVSMIYLGMRRMCGQRKIFDMTESQRWREKKRTVVQVFFADIAVHK